jgi:uncharacterized protein
MMNIKNFDFEFKANTKKMTFEGYASTYSKDLVGDIIQKGAFTKTIKERFPKQAIKILWQHMDPIGLPTQIEEDSKGLYVEGKLSDTALGRDAMTLIDDGVVNSLSIGYDVIKDELSDDGETRYLKELRLYEFSPVTFPANPEATIEKVKSFREFNKLVKELGKDDLTMLLKEGRVLSKTNRGKIKEAYRVLQEILDLDPSNEDSQKHDPRPDLDGFSQLIQEMKNYSILKK